MKLNFKNYISKWDNILVLALLLLNILYPLYFGHSKFPWRDWETSATAFTLVYTGLLYLKGYFIKDKTTGKTQFEGLPTYLYGIVTLGFLILIGVTCYQIINIIHEYDPEFLMKYETKRPVVMFSLFAMAATFCLIDKFIGKSKIDSSNNFNKAFYYSDLPTALAFLILSIYSIRFGTNSFMDPFFSGATAFQMMMSNFLWSFFDDKVFDP